MMNALETIVSELPDAIRHAADCYEDGRLDEALEACENYLATHAGHFDAMHLAGAVKIALGDPSGALPLLEDAIKLQPRSWEAVLNYSVALHDSGDFAAALVQCELALTLGADIPEAHNNRGNVLRALGRAEAALASYETALALRFDYPDALSNRGAALLDLGRPEAALQSCEAALALRPDFARAWFNTGNALRALGRNYKAIASYDEALARQPGYRAALANKIAVLIALHRNDEALAAARQASDRDPSHVDTLVDCGMAAERQGLFAEALAAYAGALKIMPTHLPALRCRAAVLRLLDKPAGALASLENLLDIKPNDAEALFQRGQILLALGRHVEALASFEQVLAAEPSHAMAVGCAGIAALNLCHWERAERFAGTVEWGLAGHGMVVPPLVLLHLSASPQLQQSGARNFAATIEAPLLPPRRKAELQRDKIRIAYVSADFREHGVGHMIAELIERHDRKQFEIHGVCYGLDDGSQTRSRLKAAFDRFLEVRGEPDAGAARRIYDLDVDIAIDLTGYARNSRPAILAARPAPIQASYLGYAGTMGAGFIDYVIADPVVLPAGEQRFVTEKIVHLPGCYQVHDSTRLIARQAPTRASAGLPASGFVFCSFNDVMEIARPVFEVWMRLLARVDGSVMWLRHHNDAACERLRNAAAVRSVDPARVVFAGPATSADHLARHRLADLFLDTSPHNGHMSVGDALWAGLPVLTCKGAAFAGRISASVLEAVGLPDLIAADLVGYEALALQLANEPERLADARRRLLIQRTQSGLFDTDRARRHIEAAFIHMHKLRCSGLPPRSFAVGMKAAAT